MLHLPASLAPALTDLGNLAVVGPTAVAAWLWLARRRGTASARRFQWPVLTAFATIASLKAVSRSIGASFADTPFKLSIGAPSGHVGMSTVVYGGVALMLLRRGREPVGMATAILVAFVLAAVALTRVTLHAHTPADVAAGFAIGGACAVWMARQTAVPPAEAPRRTAELVALMILTAALMHLSGVRFNSTRIF